MYFQLEVLFTTNYTIPTNTRFKRSIEFHVRLTEESERASDAGRLNVKDFERLRLLRSTQSSSITEPNVIKLNGLKEINEIKQNENPSETLKISQKQEQDTQNA